MNTMWDWAEARGLHFVSDEIYGAGVFSEDQGFYSAGRLAGESGRRLGDKAHIVYAVSKDFASSGLRLGALYSENESVIRAGVSLNDLCQASSHTQHMMSKILEDRVWVSSFLSESRRRVLERYKVLETYLRAMGVPVLQANAGLFCWVDLRKRLPSPDWEGEIALYRTLRDQVGLLVTPGGSMRTIEPGFFRWCFCTTDEAFEESLRRLNTFLQDTN